MLQELRKVVKVIFYTGLKTITFARLSVLKCLLSATDSSNFPNACAIIFVPPLAV